METIETPSYSRNTEYAGFWLRLAAYLIDQFIVAFVLGILVTITMMIMGISAAIFYDMDNTANQMIVITMSIVLGLIGFTATWLYYALLESSSHQGTLGKVVLNIKVTDMSSEKITFTRASGRFFGKLISSAIAYVGYLMIGFTEKKQGLHDIMAGCLVLRK